MNIQIAKRRKLLLQLIILFLVACSSNENVNIQKIIIEDGMNYYGEKFNQQDAIALNEFVVLAKNTDTLEIKLKVGISEVCQTKGCWMKVNLLGGEKMVVSFLEHNLFIPKDVAGKSCIIMGKTFLRPVSVEMQKQYAKDLGDLTRLVDAINESIIQRCFIASGIIIKE